jgi:hypothetical protein
MVSCCAAASHAALPDISVCGMNWPGLTNPYKKKSTTLGAELERKKADRPDRR